MTSDSHGPIFAFIMVPTGTGKTGQMGRHFPVKQTSGNFTQNTGKIRKNYTGKLKKILEKSVNFVNQ